MQEGDVPDALADVEDLQRETDFKPATPIEGGCRKIYVNWYKDVL
jgi:UDP-glucuronate 4-epimerase